MKNFMDDDFLLSTETAKTLFEKVKGLPIFDFHCHLSPKEIYENKAPTDIAELWLGGDHYKWRLMRNFGIDEAYITGGKSGYEKFCAYCKALSFAIGNPLYHWSHLELRRYFGIDEIISEKTADSIWNRANQAIRKGGFAPRELIAKSNVTALCTTDDPADSLEYHVLLAGDKSVPFKVLPAFRPDKALNIDKPGFDEWLAQLEMAVGYPVESFASLKKALSDRMDFFASLGCVASDHALEYIPFKELPDAEIERVFARRSAAKEDADAYRTALMRFLAAEYHKRGIVMELHIGAMRNNSTPMFQKLGPDTGFDSVTDHTVANNLSALLDSVGDNLPKVMLFTLNPKDNLVLATMTGNFASYGVGGGVQQGSAWWFNDTIEGMVKQMTDLASVGVLGKFTGMLTDSRSFLSYPRHEYFRRILCDMIGRWVESGEYPADLDRLTEIASAVSYGNAVQFFGLKV